MYLFILFCVLFLGPHLVFSETFPEYFKFAVSTSAYQVEGAWNLSGKGPSVWDWYTHTYPEKIADGSNGDIACDSYNKYEEDISFLQDLGVDYYRMSISWPRIFPSGYFNEINLEGVEYYLNLFKLLKAAGIEPLVTLYHWDLPLVYHNMGGWTNPLLADWFGEYARRCYELFGSYVKYWITLNEPQTTCTNAYSYGTFAPGYSLNGVATYICAYVHLLAHAKAYHIYHDEFYAEQQGKVSIVLVTYWGEPNNSSSEADVAAAKNFLQFSMGLLAHPIFIGNWPQVVIDEVDQKSELQGYTRSRLPKFTDEQVAYIKGTADFFGLNYYSTYMISDNTNAAEILYPPSYGTDIKITLGLNSSWPNSASSWLYNVPWGLRKLINWVSNQYNKPEIIITENGYSDDGSSIDDAGRIHYLNGHMCEVLRAISDDGCNVTGYTQWTMMDNFEWNAGYTERFGLIHVDFGSDNRTRTPKSFYEWFKNVVKTNTINCTGF
ncbi:myrosinase 1-like [Anthonomus grandis grandis]|uniref:myrosinase 1-like n=1 Tax=Anthonomus grandis grandis TaxID=2921223 RepID=UPI002166546B|nr:myrosinase 1-like [Anthonomus grandis grandis]